LSRPEKVGIVGMAWYAPRTFVSQAALEKADGCEGKYTVGLGQRSMAFCDDREDVGSLLLTVTKKLFERYGVDPSKVGRLEVGTETLVDKSKSIKTSLVDELGLSRDCEGVTSVNACYGGTAALLNSVAWVESRAWDGRVAVVVCGDIAVYEKGPARPSGGAGAFAALIAPNAPLVLEPIRATCALDVWDFYKPYHSEYAAVDGKLSQAAYLRSVDECWRRFKDKDEATSLSDFAYCCFHAPYNKLVQKGFARLFRDDVEPFSGPGDYEASLADKAYDAALRKASKDLYLQKVAPTTTIPTHTGNAYTASLYLGLASLFVKGEGKNEEKTEVKQGDRILLFSYGSGSMATMFSLKVDADPAALSAALSFSSAALTDRMECSVEAFTAALELREARYGQSDYTPTGSPVPLAPGTYSLASVDDKFRRTYARLPL